VPAPDAADAGPPFPWLGGTASEGNDKSLPVDVLKEADFQDIITEW